LDTYISHYSGDAHPSVLFQGVKFRLSIVLQKKGTLIVKPITYSTHFQRWLPQGRENLFSLIKYEKVETCIFRLGLIPKVATSQHSSILNKICSNKSKIGTAIFPSSNNTVYCHRIVAHFVKAIDFIPFFRSERDGEKKSEDYKVFCTNTPEERDALTALLNSNLFYSWFVSLSDVYHCGRELILDFPCDIETLAKSQGNTLRRIKEQLMADLKRGSVRRRIPYKTTGTVEYDEFYPRKSKPIIDEIDRVLAKHYGFTDEELDFILNYDIKYRMGRDNGEEENEE
jgi:hypothetical protein